jgi:hypothetical protein
MAVKPNDAAEVSELGSNTPAPPVLIAHASALIRRYPECFWFRHPEARIRCLGDVRLVVEHLREYGGHLAWRDAQKLHQCLLPLFKQA